MDIPRLAIIADDLTGAADAAASFARHGFTTAIAFTSDAPPDVDVLVRSSESRDRDRETAIALTREAVASIPAGTPLLYKKIDSALRGHPREELDAVAALREPGAVLVAPALPSQHRTTVGSHQLIDGVLLEQSHLASHGATSDLRALFGPGSVALELDAIRSAAELGLPASSEPGARIIADAETDEDLRWLAEAAISSRIRLLCGSAGLAGQLARVMSPGRGDNILPASDRGPVLVVAGSQHVATARQVAALHDERIPTVALDQEHIDDPRLGVDGIVAEVAMHLVAGRSVAVTTVGLGRSALHPSFVAARLAAVATADIVAEHTASLVLTGGDVAAAVLAGLGTVSLRLGGEILPAIPFGVAMLADGRQLGVVTKAGSFGEPDALAVCVAALAAGVTPKHPRT